MATVIGAHDDGMQTERHDEGFVRQGVSLETVRRFIHGLRSHLTTIGPAAEYMAADDVEQSVREEMAEIIGQSVERIEGMLADLGVIAAPGRVRYEAAATIVDMAEVSRRVVAGLSSQAQMAGVWLVADALPCPPVLGSDRALAQAVTNTLLLVLKVARRGDRVVVTLAASEAGGAKREVDLRVELEPTEDGRLSRSHPVEFEGVCLDAARIIAEQHGGTVADLTDRPGLVMRLPAAPTRIRPAVAAAGSAGAPSFQSVPPTRVR
jgi:light-regulated signal transduction histidine kinase (bacteriophytochrome)